MCPGDDQRQGLLGAELGVEDPQIEQYPGVRVFQPEFFVQQAVSDHVPREERRQNQAADHLCRFVERHTQRTTAIKGIER